MATDKAHVRRKFCELLPWNLLQQSNENLKTRRALPNSSSSTVQRVSGVRLLRNWFAYRSLPSQGNSHPVLSIRFQSWRDAEDYLTGN